MRLVFTGGSGKAGKHVIPELIAHGHTVLNVDLVPLDVPGVDNVKADITDSGQCFNTMPMMHTLVNVWVSAAQCFRVQRIQNSTL